MKICHSKTFSPLPFTEFLGECDQPTDQTLMENLGGSRKEPWWGFREQNPKIFGLFNVVKAIKWATMALKKLYLWLKKYASSKPTRFFWLIHQLMAEYNIT